MENTSTGILKIAVEFIMVALFLMIALRVIHLRDNYSVAFNNRKDVERALENTLEFSKYSGNKTKTTRNVTLTGDQVLECLRNYRQGEMVIYVDKDRNGAEIKQDASKIALDEKKPLASREFTVSALAKRLDLAAEYYPYLVYDNVAVETEYGNSGLEVTGIAFIRK